MEATFADKLRIAADQETDQDKRKLLYDAAVLLDAYRAVWKTAHRVYNEVRADLGRMAIPASLAGEMSDLHATIEAMKALGNGHTEEARRMDNNDPRDWPMIRYDQMDLNNPPDGIKLEACPNCGLPAVAKRFRVFWRFIHIAWERDRKKPRPRHFCDAYDNGRVDTCMPVLSHPSRAQRYEQVVVEQTKGSYKQFRDPGNALLADYPLEGMTYPTDYGSLPGYVGEDGDDLDVFKGSNDRGEFGRFFVFRPDIEGGMETKFYFGMTPDERAQVFTAFGPVLRGKPEAFPDHELLEAALNLYRAKEEACST